jgi:hypothetical protein
VPPCRIDAEHDLRVGMPSLRLMVKTVNRAAIRLDAWV